MPRFLSLLAYLTLLLHNSTLINAQTHAHPYFTGNVGDKSVAGNGTGPDKDGKFHISAQGIRASFIPYGATLTNMYVNDTYGVFRDVVVGYDNASYYNSRKAGHFAGVPGRYANRIMNSTFILDGKNYTVTPNEHNRNDTVNGGPNGWATRNWTLVAHSTDSITFSLYDPNGAGGFPGDVVAHVTYTVTNEPYPRWHVRMVGVSMTETSPIMLSSRALWNLDGFQDLETPTVFNQSLFLPYSGQMIETDSILVPTGNILPNALYSVNDFWSYYKYIGHNFSSSHMQDNCGPKCKGYNNCYLINRDVHGSTMNWWLTQLPVATLRSYFSGMRMNVYTDQTAVVVNSCNAMDGTLPLKVSQGLHNNKTRPRVVEKHGCLGLEFLDWVGGINHPEWQRKQTFGPGDAPYTLQAVYEFDVSSPSTTCGEPLPTPPPTSLPLLR